MEKWICTTCGTQFPPGEQLPEACPICLDERQYVGYNGQQWTTLAKMQNDGFHNEFKEHESGLNGIGTMPTFAIGERALLVQTPHGNILWDCMSLIDEETISGIERLGGLTAMAISHHTTTLQWWNGPSTSTSQSCFTRQIVNGLCVLANVSHFGRGRHILSWMV